MNMASEGHRSLYRSNIQMVVLCALMAFWLLVSPLVPYTFDVTTTGGMALFVIAHLLLTATVSAIGVTLNTWAWRSVQVTPGMVRAKLILARTVWRRMRRR